jgi:hypothetical protein
MINDSPSPSGKYNAISQSRVTSNYNKSPKNIHNRNLFTEKTKTKTPNIDVRGDGHISQTFWPSSIITPKKAATAVGGKRRAQNIG